MATDWRPLLHVRRRDPPEDYAEPTTDAEMTKCYGEETDIDCGQPLCEATVYLRGDQYRCLGGHDQHIDLVDIGS